MKKNRFEVFIIGLLIVVTFIIVGIYYLVDLIVNKDKVTIVLAPYTVISCKNDKCELPEYNSKLFNKKYYVYYKGGHLDKQTIKVNESTKLIEVYNKKQKITDSNENIYMLMTDKKNLNYIDYSIEEMNESEINSINKSGNVVDYALKTNIDYDNDGMFEDIYYLKSHNESSGQYYNVFAYKDGGYIEKISENEAGHFLVMDYFLTHIIDMNNDGIYELVLTQTGYDGMKYCSQIYRLNNASFEAMNECKIVSYQN